MSPDVKVSGANYAPDANAPKVADCGQCFYTGDPVKQEEDCGQCFYTGEEVGAKQEEDCSQCFYGDKK